MISSMIISCIAILISPSSLTTRSRNLIQLPPPLAFSPYPLAKDENDNEDDDEDEGKDEDEEESD